MKIGNHKGKLAIAGLAALFMVACVAPLPGFERIDPPEYSGAIPLQPEADKGGGEQWYRTSDSIVVRNVRQPELIAFLPDPGKATCAAVIVLPGGAFQILSMSAEGTDVAQLLADRGIAAFVLKYRLNETPANDLLFGAKIAGMLSKLADGRPLGEVRREEQQFINAIRGVEEVTRTTFEDGVRYMDFTEAVTRSAQSGQKITLPL